MKKLTKEALDAIRSELENYQGYLLTKSMKALLEHIDYLDKTLEYNSNLVRELDSKVRELEDDLDFFVKREIQK